MDWNWYLFRFNGRINRARMWLSLLIILCWMIFLGVLTIASGIVSGGKETSFGFNIDDIFRVSIPPPTDRCRGPIVPTLLIKAIGTSLFAWVYFATSIKRLHDRDKSGWWMVPFFVFPGLFKQFADRLPRFLADLRVRLARLRALHLGFCRNVLPEGLAQDQPLRARTRCSGPTRGRAGSRTARSKWCRTRLTRRRFGVLGPGPDEPPSLMDNLACRTSIISASPYGFARRCISPVSPARFASLICRVRIRSRRSRLLPAAGAARFLAFRCSA